MGPTSVSGRWKIFPHGVRMGVEVGQVVGGEALGPGGELDGDAGREVDVAGDRRGGLGGGEGDLEGDSAVGARRMVGHGAQPVGGGGEAHEDGPVTNGAGDAGLGGGEAR